MYLTKSYYKSLILILLDKITFVIGPNCIFVNLLGACYSVVLHCTIITVLRNIYLFDLQYHLAKFIKPKPEVINVLWRSKRYLLI